MYIDWLSAHPTPEVTVAEVADHIEHISAVAGIDHIGSGSYYDGVGGQLPGGPSDVSTYPALLAELLRRGWNDQDVAKLTGENVIRIMKAAEAVAYTLTSR